MATGARSFKPLDGTLGNGLVLLGGIFELTSGTTAPSVTKGLGWTAAHNSTGLYTLTLDQQYVAFCGGAVSYCTTSTSTDLVAEFGDIEVVTAKTIEIQLKTGGTLTDPTPGSGISVSFLLFLRRSSMAK